MGYALSERSLEKLRDPFPVHPALVGIVKKAITITTQDFTILCGGRLVKEQERLYAGGRTTAEIRKAGILDIEGRPNEKQVTWTMRSKHLPQPDGFAHAVDIAPWPIDWSGSKENLARFDAVAVAMYRAATIFGVRLRWGADFDGDGVLREKGEYDSPHWELII